MSSQEHPVGLTGLKELPQADPAPVSDDLTVTADNVHLIVPGGTFAFYTEKSSGKRVTISEFALPAGTTYDGAGKERAKTRVLFDPESGTVEPVRESALGERYERADG